MQSETDIWSLTQTFTYDAVGNRTLVQDSLGGVTTSVYNADNELTTRAFYDGTTPMRVDETYNADGQVATITYSSDLAGTTVVATTAYTYNADGAVTDILSENSSSTVISDLGYTYDAAGRLTNENDTGTLVTYTYDSAGQLTGDGATTVTYDATGNRNSGSYTTGAGNELTSDGTYDYSYDAAGNETLKVDIATGDTWQYGYNNKNEMMSAKDWTSNPVLYLTGDTLESDAEYKYDVLGNRIEKDVAAGGSTTTRYAYDMWNPAKAGAIGTSASDIWATLDGSGSLTSRQLQGDGIDQHFAYISGGGTAYWYLTDHLGSIRTVLDDTGTVKDAISYDAYGNITSESDADYRDLYAWTGRELDAETGLQYNRARYYDGATGRWISQDPMGFDAGDSNLYRYVTNESPNATDPNGLDFIAVGDRPLAGSGGFIGWLTGYWHLSIAYFTEDECKRPLGPPGGWFNYSDLLKTSQKTGMLENGTVFPGFRKTAAIELLRHDGWKSYYHRQWAPRPQDYQFVGVSVIRYSDSADWYKSIFQDSDQEKVKNKWKMIESAAKGYSYAEQPDPGKELAGTFSGPFKHWMNSWYISSPRATNSNTFVKWLVKQAGLEMPTPKGNSPGRESPAGPEASIGPGLTGGMTFDTPVRS